MKKVFFLLVSIFSRGILVNGMESQESLASFTSSLPKEIRRSIVALSLRASLSPRYECACEKNLEDGICTAAMRPNGKQILVGLSNGSIWSYTSKIEEGKLLNSMVSSVCSLAYSPDGKAVLAGSKNGTISLLDGCSGEILKEIFTECRQRYGIVWSPVENIFLVGSDEGTFLYSISSGERLQEFLSPQESVYSVAFSPDGEKILTGSKNIVRLLDRKTGKQEQQFTDHTRLITSVAFSSDNKTVLSASLDGRVYLWDVETGNSIKTISKNTEPVYSAAFSSDEKTILLGTVYVRAYVIDKATGEKIKQIRAPGDGLSNCLGLWSSPGEFVLFSDKAISVWKLNSQISPERQDEAFLLFKEKGLHSVLQGKPIEESNNAK